MKKTKLNILLFLSALLITSSVLVISINAATVGDTSVGVNKGDTLTWKVTEANETGSPYDKGDKLEEKVADINSTGGYLTVYLTARLYKATYGNWTDLGSKFQILKYNATKNEFQDASYEGAPAILFTPVNLTTYAAYINGSGDTAILVGSDGVNVTLILDPRTFYYIFNDKGITSSITCYDSGEVIYKMVLVSGGAAIPFGMMFLVFGAIGTIALVLIVKKRRIYVK